MGLNSPALVLNKNWQAIHAVSVARAVTMVWKDVAHFVDPDDYQLYNWQDWARLRPQGDEFITSPSQIFRLPKVIVLRRYDRLPSTEVTFSRRNVHKRDKFTCQYCGVQPGLSGLTLDHVVPRSSGGQSTWDNCVSACIECNHRKANLSLKDSGMKLRKKPTRPAWSPLYAFRNVRIDCWEKFISEAYWNVELEK
jgi:5-methylcytosine-specific restriction endonuclease McrA